MEISVWILLSSLLAAITTVSSVCEFPRKWRARWYQDTFGNLIISKHEITRKGQCEERHGNKFLVFDKNRSSNCYKCLVISEMHENILQYKESYCFATARSISAICSEINGDAPLHTIVRVPSVPVPCPFQGYHSFTYSNSTTANRHCKHPRSEIRACADESKFKFIYRHCHGMPETYDKEHDFQCLASWENGEKFLYGKFTSYTADLPHMYRCFMHSFYGGNGDMSMSNDATCQGLQSPSVGFSTMKLERDFDGEMWPRPRCRFPKFLIQLKHWRDMSGRIAVDIDEGLQIFKLKDKLASGMVIYSDHAAPSEVKMVVRCIDNVDGSMRKVKEFIVHVTDDRCQSGYRCLRLVKRGDHVLELHIGKELSNRNTACSDFSFEKGEKHMLIPANIKPTRCPTTGDFRFMDRTSNCRGQFRLGCNSESEIEIEKTCSFNRQSVDYMKCLTRFTNGDTHYVIAQKPGLRREATCLAFRETDEGIEVQEDSICSSNSRVVLGNHEIHYLMFKPHLECPKIIINPRPTDSSAPNGITSDKTGKGDQRDQMGDQGRNDGKRGNIKDSSNSKITADSSNGVINADNSARATRTCKCLLHISVLLTFLISFFHR